MSDITLKILLAEDEEMIATAYKFGFNHAGHQVTIAKDGLEAIDVLKTEIPDILLLDIIMPNMNGFEVLKKIRGNKRLKDLPVIVVSNLSQPNDEELARELGANDYLIKADYSLDQLLERIRKVLEKSRLETKTA